MHAMFEQVTDLSAFERLMRVNFFGAMWCTHAALPALKHSRGLIVGVSSLAGKTGVPGRTTYCASKFAMSGFFEALRIELADSGVGVTMIFPGVVATELRRNGLNGSGQRAGVSGLEESGAMSVQRCAAAAIAGMRARRREVVMTTQGRLGSGSRPSPRASSTGSRSRRWRRVRAPKNPVGGSARSIRRDVARLDQLLPAIELALLERLELLGRVRHHLEADRDELLLDLGIVQ